MKTITIQKKEFYYRITKFLSKIKTNKPETFQVNHSDFHKSSTRFLNEYWPIFAASAL
jgi:hypothetical protein